MISQEAEDIEAKTECELFLQSEFQKPSSVRDSRNRPIKIRLMNAFATFMNPRKDVKMIASGGQSSIYSCSQDFITKIYLKPWTIDSSRQEIILTELNKLSFTAQVKVRA